jgi:gas vesicle structural protein
MAFRDDLDFLASPTPQEQTLLGILDRLLDKGIVVNGDLRVSVAGVDLLYVGVKLLLSSIETADRYRAGSAPGPASGLLGERRESAA